MVECFFEKCCDINKYIVKLDKEIKFRESRILRFFSCLVILMEVEFLLLFIGLEMCIFVKYFSLRINVCL